MMRAARRRRKRSGVICHAKDLWTVRETFIALGANLSDPAATLPRAWQAVIVALSLDHPKLSPVYRSAPAEAATGPDFANAVGVGFCSLAPREVLARLHAIEARFGRDRAAEGHHGSRPLDLDLLAMAELREDSPTLALPHPRIAQRDFVLRPLLDLRPDWIEPRSGQRADVLLAALPASRRSLRP